MDRVSQSNRKSISRRRHSLARLICQHAAVGLIAGSLAAASTAFADFPTSTPNSGDTLNSTGGTTGINAPNSTGVTLNISGPVDPGTSPAIDIGRGVTINVTGAGELFSTPPGPASTYTVPDLFAPGVVDEASLNAALLPVIGQNSPFGSFNSPLIRLGAGGDISADIAGLTSVVTVNKARQADQAMNTITDYINGGGYTPPVGLAALLGNTVNSADSNQINNQGAIASAGSSGIFGLGGSANRIVIDGGVLGTEANNSTGYLLGGSGASEIVLINNGGIATVFNGSPAIDSGGAGSATGVQILDSVVYTLGNNSAAINGGVATNSVFALEVRGRASRLPTIGTFGDNSAGVVFRGAGNSTATVDIAGVTSNAFGAGMRTLGNNSTLFDFDTTINGGSSLTFSAIDSSFATAGNNSRVISMLAGDTSDILIFLSEVQIGSTGTNAGLITYQGGQSSITNFVGIDLDLASTGNGSGGIVLLTGMGGTSSDTTFLADSTVSTLGNDAPGLFLETRGNSSVRTVTLTNDTISTIGNRSGGIFLGGLGDGSAMQDNVDNLDVSTSGNDSPGYVTGALGNNSAKSSTIDNTTISTQGSNSAAFIFGGINGTNSVANLEVGSTNLSTTGDDSDGLIWQNQLGSQSTSTMNINDVTVNTLGDRSSGIVFGATTGSAQYGAAISASSMSVSVDQVTVATQGNDSAGLEINGFGDDNSDSDLLTFVNDADITTSGDRSIGILLNTRSENAQDIITDTVVTNSQVRTSGQQSHGVVVDTGVGTNGGTASNSVTFLGSLDIETTGDGANGLVLGPRLGVFGPTVSNELTVDSTVRASTTGDNADALVISENTLLALSSVGNPFSSIDNFDNFVATGAGSRSVQNFGTIDGGATGIVLTPGIGLRGNIANAGTILSSGPNAVTYDVAANSDDIFELQPGGVVNGNVLAGNGNDTFILGGTGIDTFDYTELGPKYQDFEAFVKEDSSRWILTGPDSSAPILPGTITGGTLVVNPNLSGFDLVIDPMGRLEGSGGVGNLTSSGAFSPGGLNQAADFGIAGNLLLQPGSLTQIDIFANGTSDMITVNGTATLGGQLFVNGVMYPTGFPTKREYVVLTSPGDVIGTFDSISDNLPDVNAMVMILPATGPLDPFDPNRPGTVIVSYERAGDESDKSIFSNSVQASGWMGRMFNETMQRRARLMTCGSALGYSGWTSGMGGFQGTKASPGASNYDAGFGGFAAGVDRVFSESGMMMRTGIAGGYLGGGLVSGPSTADLDTGFIGTYASMCGGGWLVSSAASLGFSGFEIDRGIPISGSAPLMSRGDTDGEVFVVSLTSSYNLAEGLIFDGNRALRFAPIAGLDYLHARRNGFRETDSGLLGLDVGGSSFDVGLASVGLELGTTYVSARGVGIQNFLDVRYQNLFGDEQALSSSTLTNVGGPAFTSPGAQEARDRILVGMGIGARMSDMVSLDVRYDTNYASRSVNHQGSAGITFQR